DDNFGEDHFNVVAGTDGIGISMVDADSYESNEADVSKAFQMIVDCGKTYVDQVAEIAKEIGENKYEYPSYQAPKEFMTILKNNYKDKANELLSIISKKERGLEISKFVSDLTKEYSGKFSKAEITSAIETFFKEIVKHMVLDDGKRLGGRAFDEIRQLTIKTGVLARTHGSALFQRGGTQALSIATLASMRSAQIIDGMEGDYTKRYMHHYNDYPFCYGENGRISYYPGRRAIGHGALAEKAVSFMLPPETEFPYAIRVVSEIMMSEGSTSMASTCGSSLALVNAGVKLKRLVAGISVGLIAEENYSKYQLLLDIAEGEDFYGKMDFKVAGTTNGINAIQMDNKIGSIPVKVLTEALELAKKGRFFVIEKMQQVIDSEPQGASTYIPSIEKLKIPENKIGELIGPGGKNIKAITEATTADIDIQDDGTVYVFGDTKEQVSKALKMIDDLVGTVEVGEVFEGTVEKIMDFGAFVSLKGKTSGLVHKSQISNEFVDDPRKYVKEGEKVKVKVLGIDEQGKISLTMKNITN
ncbi:MAG TPA: polyribonucleotide nucleotidyltransferase, partial [Candidatus Dojkabacteria bacterium]|nr:polyribonucleotide nucleotidyltransferase [Candidatus Dojkabacteria bacterium]